MKRTPQETLDLITLHKERESERIFYHDFYLHKHHDWRRANEALLESIISRHFHNFSFFQFSKLECEPPRHNKGLVRLNNELYIPLCFHNMSLGQRFWFRSPNEFFASLSIEMICEHLQSTIPTELLHKEGTPL